MKPWAWLYAQMIRSCRQLELPQSEVFSISLCLLQNFSKQSIDCPKPYNTMRLAH